MLASVGFEQVSVRVKQDSKAVIAAWMPGSGSEEYVLSAVVQAVKPGGDSGGGGGRKKAPALVPKKAVAKKAGGC